MRQRENHIEAAITASYQARQAELEARECVVEALEAGEGDLRDALFLVAETLASVAEHEQNNARLHLAALVTDPVAWRPPGLPKG